MDEQAAWETIKQQAVERFGPEMVFGEGSLDAGLTIVGEAPGRQEVEARRPFVGRAGRLLDQLLEAAGIDRSGIYVTNTVKVRPTTEKGGRLKNRPPRAGEVREGLEVLLPELRLVAPSALVLSGTCRRKPSSIAPSPWVLTGAYGSNRCSARPLSRPTTLLICSA